MGGGRWKDGVGKDMMLEDNARGVFRNIKANAVFCLFINDAMDRINITTCTNHRRRVSTRDLLNVPW